MGKKNLRTQAKVRGEMMYEYPRPMYEKAERKKVADACLSELLKEQGVPQKSKLYWYVYSNNMFAGSYEVYTLEEFRGDGFEVGGRYYGGSEASFIASAFNEDELWELLPKKYHSLIGYNEAKKCWGYYSNEYRDNDSLEGKEKYYVLAHLLDDLLCLINNGRVRDGAYKKLIEGEKKQKIIKLVKPYENEPLCPKCKGKGGFQRWIDVQPNPSGITTACCRINGDGTTSTGYYTFDTCAKCKGKRFFKS
jgi:hypothetical protein